MDATSIILPPGTPFVLDLDRAAEKRIREVFNKIERLPDGVHVMAI